MLYIPVYLVFTPIIFAMIIFLFHHKSVTLFAFVAQTVITVLAITYYLHFRGDLSETMFTFGGWNPLIGIGFRNDSISITMIFLSIFMWWMVLIYTFKYKSEYRNFLFFFLFLEGVFLGLLQTNDLFNMFVFIELITIIVTILVAYQKAGNSFRAAIYYLLLNTAGILSFLLGIILIYYTFGNINIAAIQEMMTTNGVSTSMTVRFAFVFILASVSVKSALFPLFTWLPRAHAVAESGVSALLSGIVVKGGVYVLIRMSQMFAPAGYDLSTILLIMGFATALVGVIFAMSQKDIKQILAFHTVSQIGIIVIGLSFLTGKGFYGGFIHLVNHAFFKSLLFLGAGIIAKRYGTKKVHDIRGVFKAMPVFSILMIVGMLGITGAPLFNGFISKSVIKYDLNTTSYWALQVVNLGTATSFVKMSQIFFGKKPDTLKPVHKHQYISMAFLAFGCLMLGLFHVPIWEELMHVDLHYFKSISLKYAIEYLILIGLGYLMFRFVISKYHKIVSKIRNFIITFETANILFLGYLTVLIIIFVIT